MSAADSNLQTKQERTGLVARSALRAMACDSDNDRMQVGKVIRCLRQEQGLTLEELALRIGSDAGNLSRIERGKQRYTPEMLQAIADALNTPISHLFMRAEQNVAPYGPADGRAEQGGEVASADNFLALRKALAGLDAGNQQLVLEFARMLSRQSRGRKAEGDEG